MGSSDSVAGMVLSTTAAPTESPKALTAVRKRSKSQSTERMRPIYCHGQPDRVQHDHHRHQPGLGDPGRADRRQRRGHGDDRLLQQAHLEAEGLRDEDRGHGFIERGAVHVDGGTQRDDELRGSLGDPRLRDRAFHGNGKRGRFLSAKTRSCRMRVSIPLCLLRLPGMPAPA